MPAKNKIMHNALKSFSIKFRNIYLKNQGTEKVNGACPPVPKIGTA